MARYDDHIKLLDGRPVPNLRRDGLLTCGWCGCLVKQQDADLDAPWLCDECGISRRALRRGGEETNGKDRQSVGQVPTNQDHQGQAEEVRVRGA